MEAVEKKDIFVIENESGKEVFDTYKKDCKIGVIDFTSSLVILPNSPVSYKRYKDTKAEIAFSQLKRWISSEAFDQVFILGGLDIFNKNLVFEWIFDHKSKTGFPNLIISGKKIPLFWNDLGAKNLK